MNIKNIDTNNVSKLAIIHGELIILPVKKLPANAKKIHEGREFIAGHSETGHHHVIEGVTTAYEVKGADTSEIYFKANTDTKIKHLKSFDRHTDMPIVKDQHYIVLHKNEYDPFAQVLRQVQD